MGGTVAVTGATGFIGSACVEALAQAGWAVRPVPAPRFVSQARSLDALRRGVDLKQVQDFAEQHLDGVEAIVNAAGLATATSTDLSLMLGANATLPLFLTKAANAAGVKRVVHLSSAAVQGRRVLDESEDLAPESPYALTKALAERLLRAEEGTQVIRYRPTSVQGAQRGVTRSLIRLAESPASAVAAPGADPSPQTNAERVAEAVTILVDPTRQPPAVVLHPWEGTTTRSVLADLGGKEPRILNRKAASAAVSAAYASAHLSDRMAGHARRLDMVLFGQAQRTGWLEHRMGIIEAGWLERLRLNQAVGERS